MRVPRGLLISVFRLVLATYIPLCTPNVRPTALPWDARYGPDVADRFIDTIRARIAQGLQIARDDWPT